MFVSSIFMIPTVNFYDDYYIRIYYYYDSLHYNVQSLNVIGNSLHHTFNLLNISSPLSVDFCCTGKNLKMSASENLLIPVTRTPLTLAHSSIG